MQEDPNHPSHDNDDDDDDDDVCLSVRAQRSAYDLFRKQVGSVFYELSAMALSQLYDQNKNDWESMVEASDQFVNTIADTWKEKLKDHGHHQLARWIQHIQHDQQHYLEFPNQHHPTTTAVPIHSFNNHPFTLPFPKNHPDTNVSDQHSDDDNIVVGNNDDKNKSVANTESKIPFQWLSELGDLDPCHVLSSSSLGQPPDTIPPKNKQQQLHLHAIQQLKQQPSYWLYPPSIIDKAAKVVTQRLHHVTLTGRKRKNQDNHNTRNPPKLLVTTQQTSPDENPERNQEIMISSLSPLYARKMQRKQPQQNLRNNHPTIKVVSKGRPPCPRELSHQTWNSWEKDILSIFTTPVDQIEFETSMIHTLHENEEEQKHPQHILQGALKEIGHADVLEQQQLNNNDDYTLLCAKRQRFQNGKVEPSSTSTKVRWVNYNQTNSSSQQRRLELDLGECTLHVCLPNTRHYIPMTFRNVEVSLTDSDIQQDDPTK